MAEHIEAGKFAPNEKVYVPHTDKYYEAKILKSEYRGQTGWFYFLHYNGWNKKYDEWVEEAGLVRASEAEAAGAAFAVNAKGRKGGPGGITLARGGLPGGALRGAKASGLPTLGGGTGGGAPLPVGLDIELPPLLKKYLVDDFEAVFEESRFVPLPRRPCVIELMEQYVAEAKDARSGTVDAEEEVAHGLQSYFDKTLLACLLYRNERAPAAQALSDGRMPSAVFGAEHLLRLLHKLPEIMPLATLSDDQLSTIATMVQDVIHWLVDHHTRVFLLKDQYLPPPGGPPGSGPNGGTPAPASSGPPPTAQPV